MEGTPLTDKANERMNRGTMVQLRDVGLHVVGVRGRIRLHHPTPEQARALKIGPGTPVFRLRTWLKDDLGAVLAVSDTIVPGDRVELEQEVDLRTGQVVGGPAA